MKCIKKIDGYELVSEEIGRIKINNCKNYEFFVEYREINLNGITKLRSWLGYLFNNNFIIYGKIGKIPAFLIAKKWKNNIYDEAEVSAFGGEGWRGKLKDLLTNPKDVIVDLRQYQKRIEEAYKEIKVILEEKKELVQKITNGQVEMFDTFYSIKGSFDDEKVKEIEEKLKNEGLRIGSMVSPFFSPKSYIEITIELADDVKEVIKRKHNVKLLI